MPHKDIPADVPQRVLRDPARRDSLEGREVFPDEIISSVFADEIEATTLPEDPHENSDLTDL
jgi:hypothetical protein